MPTVTELFLKKVKGEPMTPAPIEGLELKSRFGVINDVNANPFTPRQVLITCVENLDKFNIKPGNLKENIVIKGYDVDSLPSGTVVEIGETQIRITFNCEPCSYVETIRKGLAKDIHGKRGILGVVLKGGKIRIVDEFKILDKKFDEIPFNVAERFKWLIDQIPLGKVISYKQIIYSLGLFSVYYRVIPTYVHKCAVLGSPVHRVLNSNGELISSVEGQKEKLESEGIKILNTTIDLDQYLWDTGDIYYK